MVENFFFLEIFLNLIIISFGELNKASQLQEKIIDSEIDKDLIFEGGSMRFYSFIFISIISFFQLSSMEKDNNDKSNCSCLEWLICCRSSKSSERTPMVSYTIQENDKDNEALQKNKKRSSLKTKDKTMHYFLDPQ